MHAKRHYNYNYYNNQIVLCFTLPWPLRFPPPFLCLTNDSSNLCDGFHTASPLHYNPLILFHHFFKNVFSFSRPDWVDLINIILPHSHHLKSCHSVSRLVLASLLFMSWIAFIATISWLRPMHANDPSHPQEHYRARDTWQGVIMSRQYGGSVWHNPDPDMISD